MAEIRVEQLLKWPDAETTGRASARFKVGSYKTEQFLRSELYKISARSIVLRTFHQEREHRRDGGIRVDARAPSHPGVILEFERPIFSDNGDAPQFVKMRLPCDMYRNWEDNLRALALVLEGLRMIDRHGVSQGAQYQGYLALPPKPGELTLDDAALFLAEHSEGAVAVGSILGFKSFAEMCYKTAAKKLHPDKEGGSEVEFAKLENSMRMIREHHSI
jgi:hypothetical protein